MFNYKHAYAFIMGFPGGSAGKESTCNTGDLGSIPGLGRSPGEGNGYSLLYSGLENSMDCMIHGVAKNQTLLSDFTLLLCIYYMLFCNHLSFIINIITYSTNIDQNYFLQILDFEI